MPTIIPRLLCAVLLTAILPLATARAAEPQRRPNVLIVMPDQMRGMAMGCMGNPDVKTPNLDRLASQGLLLRRVFANTPVCCPARAIMLTGTYAHENGMVANDLRLRESKTTIAEILAARGYRTGYVGKWHLDGGPRLPGFVPPGPRRQGFQFWAANECSHDHFKPTYFRDTDEPITDPRFEPEVWTDRAIEFLQKKDDAPFFLMVSMGPPHDPYGAPDRYEKLYDPAKLTVRPNWVAGTRNSGRAQLARYYAAITAIDDQVGRMLKALDESGQADNTIVLFTSDHGDMLGSHGRFLKRKPWEESIRVPGIVRYPARIKPGRINDALFTHVDMAPTLLSLCGVVVPDAMQGVDLSAVLLGPGGKVGPQEKGQARRGGSGSNPAAEFAGPESAFFQIFVPFAGDVSPLPWRGVRTADAMYARTEKGPWLLYDLAADPYEQTNLVDDPAHAALRESMDALVINWMKRVGDSWSNDSMATVEDKGRLYRFGTFYTIQEYLDWAKEHPELAPKD